MFKRIALLLSMVLALAVSSSAGAQEATPPLNPADVEGLESGYARMYIADIEAMMATPGAMEEMSLDDLALSGMAAVFTFEDEDAADAAFGEFSDMFPTLFMESGKDVESTDIDDLGDQAVEHFGEMVIDDETTAATSMILVQDGEHIFIAMIMGGSETSESTRAFAEYLLDGEISDAEIVFNEDGSSTGGVYDIMPNEENTDIVQGMVPFMDADFMADTQE